MAASIWVAWVVLIGSSTITPAVVTTNTEVYSLGEALVGGEHSQYTELRLYNFRLSSQAISCEGVDPLPDVPVDRTLGLAQGGEDEQQEREERHGRE